MSRSHPRRRDGHVVGTTDDGTIGERLLEPLVDDSVDARIVRTKQFTAKPMDPGEAALQLQLLGHDFYLFTNSETGRAAVIYRRHDGDLGLIDTDD